MEVHVSGNATDAEFQQVVAVLHGLCAVRDDLHLRVTETDAAVRIQVTSHATTPTTVTSLEELLRLLREHVTFAAPQTSSSSSTSRTTLPSTSTPLRLFVGGDRSQVGKSTVCLGILGALMQLGYHPSELAYIKPATQCEEPQLISRFCSHYGIAAQPIGPVVFYSGFTRSFLDQPDRMHASQALLQQIVRAVDAISSSKRVVLIDGVGYPAVGSICGVSNADVAAALQPISVVLVGKKGVGDAVDSFNLNATYFSARHVRVLGAIFNRLPPDGYYSLDQCKAAVSRYFATSQSPNGETYKAYGFLPELPVLQPPGTTPPSKQHESALPWHGIVHAMMQHVDVRALVADAAASVQSRKRPRYADVMDSDPIPLEADAAKKPRRDLTIQWAPPPRAAVQAAARQSGAPTA